jgi:hypothetical protein
VRRSLKRRKNGNWTNEQLSSAIAAFDNGMNMKKTSEQFHIPYTSFRKHVYGMWNKDKEVQKVFLLKRRRSKNSLSGSCLWWTRDMD